jgi:hypothetical protein
MNDYEQHGDYAGQKLESSAGIDAGAAVRFLLIGMGIGAFVALLFTPMKGSELRNAMAQGFRHTFDGISEQTRNLRDHGSNLLGFNRPKAAGADYEQRVGI